MCFYLWAEHLKPIAEEERRVEEAEKKAREEQERIYKQLSEGNIGPHPVYSHLLPACYTNVLIIPSRCHVSIMCI